MSKNIREVSPFLQKIRELLLGRPHTLALRFQDGVASRSPPLPNLPDGPAHRLNANYYYSRDARREVAPPEVVPTQQLLEAGEECEAPKKVAARAPGAVFKWD